MIPLLLKRQLPLQLCLIYIWHSFLHRIVADMVPRVNKPHGQACHVVHSLPFSHTAAAGLTKFHSNLPMKEKEKENRVHHLD